MNAALLICLAVVGAEASPVDFDTHIVPVLTKGGCNAGACHGAAAGRGGFNLSLLGSDPARDYAAIVYELEGRRINLAKPELSLLLAKPSGRLDHGGDVVLPEGEIGAERVLDWIRAGAPRGGQRKLLNLEVTPKQMHCDTVPAKVQIQATAYFDASPPEDVTAWVLLTASDTDAVAVDSGGPSIEVRRRGQHVVIARYLDRVVACQINAPFSTPQVDLSMQPRANFIDDEVLKVLGELGLEVTAPADDVTFLRRVRLDLTGKLPSPREVQAFSASRNPNKRAVLVDELLASEEFADYWTLRLARDLRIHGLPNESEGVHAYAKWLRGSLIDGTPFDEMARQLITATGDAHVVGPANFGRMVADAREQAELIGRFFMGVRLGCANCHNHPLDQWTQDDYHGLAAVFARLERGRNVQIAPRGSVTNVRTGEPAIPRIPGERYLEPDEEQIDQFARWLTSGGQSYFARATVNRLWYAMFGRGLVEPVDDMRQTNPATHPELLQRLATDFVDNGYDLRHTLRLIAVSHAYARSERAEEASEVDDRFYSRGYRRPLMPEVIVDAIADVTGVDNIFRGQPRGTRAIALVDPLLEAPSLDSLGRCAPSVSCVGAKSATLGVATQLHLINGGLINGKLNAPEGHLSQMLEQKMSDQEIVRTFFVRGLSREPTADELAAWQERLAADSETERRERLEDFVWSLLNSRQFLENH